MDKMKMETANQTLDNLAKLKEMFPEVITESKDENGEIVAAVDAKKLEQLLSTKVIDGDECYDFTWVGKKQAMIEACKPIRKTLRPCREESVDWENTQNLYIEGDNLDVLKLLQESYLNKVKMIYIDPPYNTGNDSFIYPDDYSTNKDAYDEEVGAIDESGYWMFKNTETNGRFHSSWCSMIYPRLKLARNLLSEDGVIFISIDDNEYANLKKICDEVFGSSNSIANFIWRKKTGGGQTTEHFAVEHEYILIYAKNFSQFNVNYETETFNETSFNKLINGRKAYIMKLEMWGTAPYKQDRPSLYYPIKTPDGDDFYPKAPDGKDGRWRKKPETLDKDHIFWQESKGILSPYEVTYYDEVKDKHKIIMPRTILYDFVENTAATKELISLLGGRSIFQYSKPVKLIHQLIKYATKRDSIVLDFFSGSATTAHAVMQLNAEDGGKRKFIMVQLPEVCDEKSEAYKAGYKNICEIGKERIRRAGKKIVKETGKKDLDIGFRILKLADGNMKDVYYTPEEYNQKDLVDMASNIKDDRTPEDLLYACMLEWGLELSLPHKVQTIARYNVHIVDDGALVACFDDKISEDAIKQIAELQPLRAVFRDSGFAGDAARVNVGEIFKLKSPNTTIKVL